MPGVVLTNGDNRVAEIEEKIGAGLIEEVIEVAKGERELVERMAESQV